MLIWKNSYSIGIELIDIQHKHLFDIGNEAYSLLENDMQTDKYDAINLIVEDLRSYAKYHLKCEENYMVKTNYSGYKQQKKEHDYFIKKVNEIQLYNIDKSKQKIILDLLSFIFNWISQHILEKDKLITIL